MPQNTKSSQTPQWIVGEADYLDARSNVARGWVAAARSDRRMIAAVSASLGWGAVGSLVLASGIPAQAFLSLCNAIATPLLGVAAGVCAWNIGANVVREIAHRRELRRVRDLIDEKAGSSHALLQTARDPAADDFARLVALVELKARQKEMRDGALPGSFDAKSSYEHMDHLLDRQAKEARRTGAPIFSSSEQRAQTPPAPKRRFSF